MDNGNADRPGDSDTGPLDGTPLDRRSFLGLAATTGAALTLPESATASSHVTDPRVNDLCQFVINNTPSDYETTVLVEFADDATADWFDTNFQYSNPRPDDPEKTVIRKSPTQAGHGRLTDSEISTLLTDSGVNSVEFSPGANPFWKLGGYADGVFPDPIDARDYLSYSEAIAGVNQLESEHPNRVRNTGIGKSPGWYDKFSGVDRQWDVHLTAVTNNVGDPSFADKEKVVYSLSIHGDERAGAEGGVRLIEDVLTGDAPEVEQLLDDIVLMFLLTNPDGWVSREPWVEIGSQSHDRNFQRYTGGSYGGPIDPNRQYPTIGWTNPDFLPAEPDGAPSLFRDEVPDALSVVDHFRGYENVALFCDYHGMYDNADHMMYYLESNAAFDYTESHLVDELSRQTGTSMLRYWGDVAAIEDDIRDAATVEYGSGFLPSGDQFNGLFDWGTIYDTINYQVTGGMMGWAGAPERFGGLGAVAISPEIIISNNFSFAIQEWKPWWTRHTATAYQLSMREYAKMAAVDTDATIATGDRDTAYVTTDELTRSSTDLPFTGPGAPDSTGSTTLDSNRAVVSGSQTGVVAETGADAHSLSVRFEDAPRAGGTARLVAPDGTVHDTVSLGRDHGADTPELFVLSPAAGEWTVAVDGATDVTVHSSVLASPNAYPDPSEAWGGDGFQQSFYEVNPMNFFDDLSEHLVDGSLDAVTTGDVAAGALDSYDQLVVSHDVATDDTDYVDAIESFVDGGGDLVLTDRGVHLLGALDTVDIDGSDVRDTTLQFGTLSDTELTHPLLDGVRNRQQELYKGPQVGYTAGTDQPATVVDSTAFGQAGGEIAGEMSFDVGLGRLTVDSATIDCIGSILPPAQQEDVLHPFGMADHAVSMMGYSILCNALNFEQRRLVAGELVQTTGPDWRGVENTIGNVDRDGELDVVDAVRVQRQLAELDPRPFDPELADVDRDGDVSITDAVRIQRQLAGLDEPGELELLGSSASVDSGTLTLQAEVENVGDLGAIRETEFRLAENAADLDQYAVVALEQADPAGNSTKTVTATVETAALSPGTTYQYSVDCAGQQETGEIQIPSN